jgi:uncharacterized protein YoxC
MPDEDLQRILQRIDENLSLRPLLNQPLAAVHAAPPPQALAELENRIAALRELRAPLYVLKGFSPQSLVKLLINLPLQVFARKQFRYNHELLDALSIAVASMRQMYQQIDATAQAQTAAAAARHDALAAELQQQAERVEQLASAQRQAVAAQEQLANEVQGQSRWIEQVVATQEQLASEAQGQSRWLEQVVATQEQLASEAQGQSRWLEQVVATQERLAGEVQGQSRWIEQVVATQEQLANEAQGQSRWIEQVVATQEQLAGEVQGQSRWVGLLQRKHDMLALDVRERAELRGPAAEGAPAPHIVDPEGYQLRLAEMGDDVRVNVGAGEKPLPDYINVDARELPEIDVVAEARNLPFEPASLSELMSAHLVEHFREHQFRAAVVPYWKSLLRPGGALRVICPNWAAMLERLNDGRLSLAEFKLLTFGAQDYQGDDHFAMYTPDTLTALLREAGFERVDVIASDRMNGICPELELVAYR